MDFFKKFYYVVKDMGVFLALDEHLMDKVLNILTSLKESHTTQVLETIENVILPALVIKSSPVLNNKVWEIIKDQPFLTRSKIYT